MRKITLLFTAVIMVSPFLLMLTGSLQSIYGVGKAVSVVLKLVPAPATLANYADIVTLPLFPLMALNSAIMVVSYVVPTVLVCGAAGYAFAFFSFRGKKTLFLLAMATVFVPAMTIMIPRYMTMRVLGLVGIPAVLVMQVFAAPTIFMFRNYFASVPESLVESARIDGAGDWQTFRRVVLPLSRPLVAAASVFQAVAALGDYLWQMLNLVKPPQQPLLIGLYRSMYDRFLSHQATAGMSTDFGYQLAVAVVIMLPMFLIFALSSRYFVGELTLGGTKE